MQSQSATVWTAESGQLKLEGRSFLKFANALSRMSASIGLGHTETRQSLGGDPPPHPLADPVAFLFPEAAMSDGDPLF
jgi:hypothetical protein